MGVGGQDLRRGDGWRARKGSAGLFVEGRAVGGHEAQQRGATGRESVRVGGGRWNGMKWNNSAGR